MAQAQAPAGGDAPVNGDVGRSAGQHTGGPHIHTTSLTEDLLKEIVCGMLSGDRRVLKRTVARYFAPEASLYHPLVRASDRAALYKVYRAYTAQFDSKPEFREIIIQGDRAMVWVDQHIRPRLPPFTISPRAVVPTLVILKFRPRALDGAPVIFEQIDHHSMYMFTWSYVPLASWLFERVWQPLGMRLLALTSDTYDLLSDTLGWARLQFGFLPQDAADRISGGYGKGKEEAVVQAAGSRASAQRQGREGGGREGAAAGARPYVAVKASTPGVGLAGESTAAML